MKTQRTPTHHNTTTILAAVVAVMALTLLPAAHAAAQGVTRSWTGSGGTANWNISTNWFPFGTPDDDDLLVIGSGDTAGLNTNNVDISDGGRIVIRSTAVVTLDTLDIGSFGEGTLDMSGFGSTLNLTGASSVLTIGGSGNGTLNIANSAAVSNDSSTIGSGNLGVGTVTIDSAGTWTNTGTMTIGNNGTGTLEIRGGGSATIVGATFDAIIGDDAGSVGRATIDGAGSTWTIGNDLYVGNAGQSQLEITDQGTVTNVDGFVGFASGSNGSVTVSGTGSLWDNSSSLRVGESGTGTLNINSGAIVTNSTSIVGLDGEGTVNVNGGGSTWTNSSTAILGNTGTGTVNVTGGGAVTSGFLLIGNISAGVGTVTIDGAGSSWNDSGTIFVGHLGNGTLNITGGGVANANGATTDVIIANLGGSTGNLSVSGTGSTLSVGDDLFVGNASAGTATATIGTGGTVSVTDETSIGSAGMLTIDGGSLSTTSFDNSAGGTLTFNSGTLTVDGGAFDPGAGNFSLNGSSTSTLNLQGSASSTITGDLTVGDTGDAVLNVANGHLLVATNATVGSMGQVNLGGGTLSVTSFTNTAGGSFDLQNGILQLGGGTLDNGTSLTLPNGGTLSGNGTVTSEINGQSGSTITLSGGTFTLGDSASFLGFVHEGTLDVAAETVTLNSAGFAQLGGLTTLAGGTLNAANGVVLGIGDNLTGSGTVSARVAAGFGTIINASGGNLTLGDSSSPIGFSSDGVLNVGSNTVTLNDSTAADLGTLTTLASGTGTLTAANGLTNDFDGNITGFGTVNTPNNAATPLINNGNIIGDDPNMPITLSGYVKGVGTCDNCNITGTDAPGFSTAAVNRGTVSYNGTLEIELGGTSPGSGYDQLNHILGAGLADLGGTLDVSLINGFTPSFGDTFDIITATTVQDTFDSELLPTLAGNLQWIVDYQSSAVSLLVVLAGDFDFNGEVNGFDFLEWQRDPSIGSLADWKANYGMVAPLSATSAAVPEPATFMMLLIGMLALHFRRDVFVA